MEQDKLNHKWILMTRDKNTKGKVDKTILLYFNTRLVQPS